MARVLGFIASWVGVGAGCAQIAGIDQTNDHARGGNAATVKRVSIGKTLDTAALDLNGLRAKYFVANPNSPTGFDAVLAADAGGGRWTADLQQPAAIELTLPDLPAPIPQLFSFPSRELAVLYSVLEHPNPSPPPDAASLVLTVKLDAAITGTEHFQIFTVGSWTVRELAAAEVPIPLATTIGPVKYAFSSSVSNSGRPLIQLTKQDVYTVLRYVGAALTGVAVADPFEQLGNDSVAPTMVAAAADQTLDVKFDPAPLTARYASVRPAVAALAMDWGLTAAPGASVADHTGPRLHGGGLMATDVGVTVKYANPFAALFGWNAVFALATSESRVFMPSGTTTPVTLFAGMTELIAPSAGFALTLPAGLPELISLDNKPLSTDGQSFAQPTRFVEATFIADRPSADMPNALYGLQVYDLLPNAAKNGLDPHPVLIANSNEAKFELPPEIFQVGHSYVLRAIVTVGGYPNLDTGDLATRALTMSQSFLDSAVIMVTP